MSNQATLPQKAVGESLPHDSAVFHVSGSATYIDDIPEPAGLLYAAVGKSPVAHGTLTSLQLQSVRDAAGVIAVLTAADVPGHLDIGAVFPGDLLLTPGPVDFVGQALFLVVAQSERQAREAALLAHIEIDEKPPQLDPEAAVSAGELVRPTHTMQRGDAESALARAPQRLQGALHIGGQEHFYLEGQVSLALPNGENGIHVHASTQHPSEVQKLVAEVLGLSMHDVVVETRRMGGGFGGKETQAAHFACLAALAAQHCRCAVKLRLPRGDDFVLTGKRHPFVHRYEVGFDQNGRLLAAKHVLTGNCGHSPDLSDAIVDRAMFHADNAYYTPDIHIVGHRARTNVVSHTAFRGFGGPQGVIAAESLMDDVARAVQRDPLDVRLENLYGKHGDLTPYHQQVEDVPLAELMTQLAQSAEYNRRRDEITQENKSQPLIRRGLALTPVKFGISFTVQHLNQAGALILLYTDGSVLVNHGGTEMGQGLYQKVIQIVAQTLGIDSQHIRATATRTDKVPNTSPTAASSGTDLNGMAARDAALTLRQRLVDFLAERDGVPPDSINFANGQVSTPEHSYTFAELVQAAYMNRIALSATGYYRTPKIHYDRDSASGRPFFYYACGAACVEVALDTLTGEYKIVRADLLHDVGQSINPALDIGQIEGAFIQGAGWLTTEELVWNDQGRLLSNGPAVYKIPTIGDMPSDFRSALFKGKNAEATVYRSRAVGEPPFMLGCAVFCALRDAAASVGNYQHNPPLDAPATPERMLNAIEWVRKHHAMAS